MDTPKPFMDTASPVAQDKQRRVLELGRGSNSKSQLQSPTSGLLSSVTDANTAVASSLPSGVADATVSACAKPGVLGADYDMVVTSGTDPSPCDNEPGFSQQHKEAGLSDAKGLTKNQKRKQRKILQKQKFQAVAGESNVVTKRPCSADSMPYPSMQKKIRKDVQPSENIKHLKDIPHKVTQPQKCVQSWENISPVENAQTQKYAQTWENIHVYDIESQKYVQTWENIHPMEDIQPQKYIQPWENIHHAEDFQSQKDVQPWANIQPVENIQPQKYIHSWENIHHAEDFQSQKDVRPWANIQPQKDVRPQKHGQPSPCTKMVIAKMDFPSDRLSVGEAESIQREILMLTDSIPIGARLPKILGISLMKGALVIQCSDTATVEWIRVNFSNNSRVLGYVALKVLNVDELPKPVKVAFKTKEKFSDPNAFLRRLQRLNPELKSTEWRVLQFTSEANTARWILEVDLADLEAIRRADFGAFTGLDRGIFKILHDPNRRNL